MIKNFTFFTLTFFTLLLTSCGKDGSPGDAYLALDWDWYVDGYSDDNPDLPGAISRNFDYSTSPGSYHCTYICSDGSGDVWYWEYDYTIKINHGENGKLFRKGDDGKDRYHKMFLNGLYTPTFTVTEKNANKPLKEELHPFSIDEDNFEKIYHGDPILETYEVDGFQISIRKRMFTLE